MSGRLSTVALIPVLVTAVVLPVLVLVTAATVRQDNRRNAYFARRWAESQYRPFTGSRIWLQVVFQHLVLVQRDTGPSITGPDPIASGIGAAAALPPPAPVTDRPEIPAVLTTADLDPWISSAKPVIGSIPSPRTPGEPR